MAQQLQLKDFLDYRFLSQPKYAPDGKRAAFVVANANEEENCYEHRLWLWDGAALKQLTDLGKESGYIWEDDTHLLFPAVRSKAEQKRTEAKEQFTSYYHLDVNGGEALPAFTLPFAARSLKRVCGSLYAVAGSIDANCPDYYKLSKEEREKVAKAYADEADYEVLDEIPFWHNGGTYANKKRTALFLVDVDTLKIERVTAPTFQLQEYEVLGGKVYFAGADFETKAPMDNGLWVLDAETGAVKCLAEKNEARIESLLAVNGRLLAQAAKCDRFGLNENPYIYTVDTETGALTLLRAEEYNLYNSTGSDCRLGGGESFQARGEAAYFNGTREGNAFLQRLLPDGSVEDVLTKPGSVESFAVNDNADCAFLIGMYDNQLQELYTCDLASGELTQISHFNEKALAGKYVADYHPLNIRSCGLNISGWVLLPRDYDSSKTYPAVLDIHGGPKTVYGPIFYHEMQVWANLGYFVFFCNPKGGDGRDNEFADIRGEYGHTDYQNLMDFTDAVLAAYPAIDPKRVCVTGGSYGGFMTNWIIGHTDRFVCAASQRSIANWLGFYGMSDIGYFFASDQCAGDIYDDAEKLWDLSPLKYAKNVVTPTLFIHSDEDYRCPLPEGLQMLSALADRGVPTRLCLFHGENHELSRSGKPKHRVRRLTEITNWFEKYAK